MTDKDTGLVERLRGWSGTLSKHVAALLEKPGSNRVQVRNAGKAYVARVQAACLIQAADHIEALEAALQAAEGEVVRLREGLEPFARIAGPINGEEGRPTYLDAIMRVSKDEPEGETEELAVTMIFDTGGRGAVLWADDFRKARSLLPSPLREKQGEGEST